MDGSDFFGFQPLIQVAGERPFPPPLLRARLPILRVLPDPTTAPSGSRLRAPFVPRDLQCLNRHRPSTNSCRPGSYQSSGASRPRIRRIRNGGFQPTNWFGRTCLFQGRRPSRRPRAPKALCVAPWEPTLDSAHPGARRRARFHSLNVPLAHWWGIGRRAVDGALRADSVYLAGGEMEGPNSSALSLRRLRPVEGNNWKKSSQAGSDSTGKNSEQYPNDPHFIRNPNELR